MNAQSPHSFPPEIPLAQSAARRAGAVLTIDLAAIQANFRLLRARANGLDCAAVVKADAYGLGAAQVAPALAAAGCRRFFVAHLEEGIALRQVLPDEEIFVLHGLPRDTEIEALNHRLIPVLNTLGQVDAWAGLARSRERRLPAVLHVDTGMARLGLTEADVRVIANDPARLDGLTLRYVMSHLAAAEDPSNPSNARQLQRFEQLRTQLPPTPASFANSSGVFLGAAFHFDLLRPGAALYGVAPVPGRDNPMHPVVRLQGRVLQVATVPAGSPVGYNGRFVADGAMRVATVSVGYADGFPRTLGNRAAAGCDGARLPVIGAVSMDMITLDVSALPDNRLYPGALVDVIGGDADSLDAVAAKGGTIAYEILTSLGSRYWRHYTGAEAAPLHPHSR